MKGGRAIDLDALEEAIERELLRQGFEIHDHSERVVRSGRGGDPQSLYVTTDFSRVVKMEKAGRSGQ